jgi:hypothetical protein
VAIPVIADTPKLPEIRQSDTFISERYVLYAPVTLENGLGEEFSGNCVMYVKYRMNRLNEAWGVAKYIKPTSDPYIGGAVLTNEGRFGHVAYITDIKDDTLFLIEANFIPNKISTRSLSLDDPVIRGFK